ncbi:MAG TPA: hypothetical protein VJU16_02850 [Planctomycetota bacterium]|nr:hypothetical protein [Planctomycetota bacterium]
MKRATLLVLLAGCTTPVQFEDPEIASFPGVLIAHAGASLYVLEASDDWLDDGNDFLIRTIPRDERDYESFDRANPPERFQNKDTSWMGEQALEMVLRWALKKTKARLIGHVDFQPRSGHLIEVTLFSLDSESGGGPDGAKRTGFRVRLKATSCKNPALVNVEWEADKLTDGPRADDRGRPGQFPRTSERINLGSGVLPSGATLFMHHRKEANRSYFLLLRIASLE